MKTITPMLMAGAVLGIAAVLAGCEWESVDNGFNTSQGAGANVNFSGVYTAKSGGALVASDATITQFVIAQSGNAVEVWDNNGSHFTGSVGSPGVVSSADPTTLQYPAGATMVESQMTFSGENSGNGNSASFVGLVHAVAVTDVKGTTVTTGVSTNDVFTIGSASNVLYSVSESSYDNQSTTTYSITEANTQYVLQGTWSEDGANSVVYGIAPSSAGTIVVAAN